MERAPRIVERGRVALLSNRMVVFTTNWTSYHGHPEPLACPAGRSRKSLSLFYFTNRRPDGEETVPAHARYRMAGRRRRLRQLQEQVPQFLPPVFWDWRAKLYHGLAHCRS